MTPSLNKLIEKLKTIASYLNSQLKYYPDYQQLIIRVTEILEQCNHKKITIKLASYSIDFSEKIKNFNLKRYSLVDYLNFEIVDLNQEIEQIFERCDLLCLIYNSQLPISSLEKQLIEQADLRQIKQALLILDYSLINDNFINQTNLDYVKKCLKNNHKQAINQFLIRLNANYDLKLTEELNPYYQLIDKLVEIELDHYIDHAFQALKIDLFQYFKQEKKSYWQKINSQKANFLQGENSENFKQRLNQTIQKLNKEQQQIFKVLKQNINQYKLNLLNPFIYDSLMYQVQQAIEKSEILESKENNKTYLYLIIKEKQYSQKLSTYIISLCQQVLSHWFEQEWDKLNSLNNESNLYQFLKQTEPELKSINSLTPKITNCQLLSKPSFEINDFIAISILEETSKTLLDYHYSQSTWFRLTVALIIGLIIFLVTSKLFGFIIIVFQLINLFTAQNAKTIRIKQQTKELKRIVDGKYQSLVRLLCDRAGQILITTLEEASQQYQIELDAIASKADEQLNEVKQKINSYKDIINQLKQDQAEIEKLLL
ncbi:FHA domain containing protein [Stanieria sp. NIES-3757]|nr:FHA domain containing protein [Stanieria sp. NIES-3757]